MTDRKSDNDAGMANRRRVLGDAWVDKAQRNTNAFNAEFQDLITRYAWNEIWGREALGDKTRRLMVLCLMLGTKSYEEFAMHVRAALDGPPESRLAPEDIKEVLMMAAIYCGVPTANHAFGIAAEILREKGLLPPKATPNAMLKLNFITQGRGPTIVLSHALGCDLTMWDETAALLAPDYTVLRYDHRGHGKSEVVPGPCSIEDMVDDAAALIAEQVAGPVHFVGLSMGGMVAQQIAVRHPQLISSIVVANSSSQYDDAARAMWRARIETVLNQGMAAIADGAMQRWFTPEFRGDPVGAIRVAQLRSRLEATDPVAYAAACDAVSRIEFSRTNPRIACPALVIGGLRDEAAPMAMSETISQSIAGAQLAGIDASHLSAVEKPAEFAKLVVGFIRGQQGPTGTLQGK